MKSLFKPVIPALFAAVMAFSVTAVSAAPLTLPADSAKIYQVQGKRAGTVLRMYQEAGGKGIIVNVPHNATWIVRRNGQKRVGNTLWEKVTWDDQTGWVRSNHLRFDARATQIARQRRECMKNPSVKDKMCCGYPEAAKGTPFRSVPIYSVQNLKPGQSLMMYVDSGTSAVAVEIPHNGTWVAKLNKVARVGKGTWSMVRWAGQNGWVDDSYLRYDAEQTRKGDAKRRRCSNGPLLAAATPEQVCLPASVVRRLQQSGALSSNVIQQLRRDAGMNK